ncbi:vacuolar protein sorting-associated protein 27 [Trichoderma asperellum]|uniref:Vacuolar protein sorting-associated protein 27 n=1 Tax=Trichoderma asperellum TaxID=101201 RepID=A0A6V8QVQ6_TRIAP|nr:vacuolar protein sorting-associated protein 27 [Trichoderma asperellum]
MMSWWSSSANTALDEQIEKATSSSLEDIALNLEISDVIRSKTVAPKAAMQSLKKRIGNKNPNTQLSALNLTDTCVKNGGSHFLTEIASREFMDNLTSLLQAVGPVAINAEVKSKILELIQSWAGATEGRYELSYIGEVYKRLQREGYQFPPQVTVASSMIDSSAGFKEPNPSLDRTPTYPHKTRSTSAMQPRNARVDDGFDEDLKKALAMSLEEVGNASRGRVAPVTSNGPRTSGGDPVATKQAEEEDEDLKAAIAASLADMEEQKKRHAAVLKEQTSGPAASSSATFTLPKNDYELTAVEAENINLFATLVDRLQTQPPGTILREPQIQELYDSIGSLRPKLARTYGETMSKHDTLLDLHAKLSTVVRYYDRMLEDRLSKAYSQQNLGGYNLPPPRQSSGPYPSIHSHAPSNSVGAESFYTNQQQPGYAPSAPPGPQLYQLPPQQAMPQSPYPPYAGMPAPDAAPGPYAPQQRTDSWNNRAPSAPDQFQQQQAQENSEERRQPPQQAASSPSTDPNASYYFNTAQPLQNAPPADAVQSPYPNLNQSPMPYQRGSVSAQAQATPVQTAAQPSQPPNATPMPVHSQMPPVSTPQQPYQQDMPPQSSPYQVGIAQQQQPPAPPPEWAGYANYAMPPAPQHEPVQQQQPVKEEALIEF